ncbi:MAG: hypothetical protein WC220_15035, partial [Pedobacter sp.]
MKILSKGMVVFVSDPLAGLQQEGPAALSGAIFVDLAVSIGAVLLVQLHNIDMNSVNKINGFMIVVLIFFVFQIIFFAQRKPRFAISLT